jgi:hypothetical protein
MLDATPHRTSSAMPVPALAVAAYAAISSALPAAAPVIGAAAVSLAIISAHKADEPDLVKLAGSPEVAAECMQRNVASLKTRMVAYVQPLHGTATMGVIVKMGVVGDPIMNVVIQDTVAGSRAQFTALGQPEQQPDMIARLIAGC